MFREMRRKKQQLTAQECVDLLTQMPRGVLSVLGDGDYPYGIPISHYYCPEDGHIYFHGAPSGHKADALRTHEKVSFCVYDEGVRHAEEWALHFRCVVVFGKAREVIDHEKAMWICEKICRKFTDDDDYIAKEIRMAGDRVQCFEIIPEHITGKRVKES